MLLLLLIIKKAVITITDT